MGGGARKVDGRATVGALELLLFDAGQGSDALGGREGSGGGKACPIEAHASAGWLVSRGREDSGHRLEAGGAPVGFLGDGRDDWQGGDGRCVAAAGS